MRTYFVENEISDHWYFPSSAHLPNDGHSIDTEENGANVFLTQATTGPANGSASNSRSTPSISDVPKLPQIIPSNSN